MLSHENERRRLRPRLNWGTGTRWLPVGLALAVAPAWPADWGTPATPLQLHYQERPPYTQRNSDGSVRGLLATPVSAALTRAGIAWRWVQTPAQRQLAIVQNGSGPDCAIGWFRNAQREALGKFSRALYRDQPLAALVRRSAALPPTSSLQELLNSTTLRLLVKDGFSYGARVDRLLQSMPAPRVSTSSETHLHTGMLLAGRADWMLVAPEEAEVLLRQAGAQADALQLVTLADMDSGSERHLYCSPAVPDTLMQRIDAALLALPGAPAESAPARRAAGRGG